MTLQLYLNTLRLKGYLAYEYNPFHNYLTNEDLYEKEGFLIPKGHAIDKRNGLILNKKGSDWVDSKGNKIDPNNINNIIAINSTDNPTYVKGSVIDLDTDKLNFDLEHPVDITIQPSYDGSVNLILNDNKNLPRLINSRFSVRLKGTYEIVDRIGENDTNIYNSETFDKDTSLYFLYDYNPIITYNGLLDGGNLLSGAYCFYITYCDADDNESDIVAESGVIPVFLGQDSDPRSMEGGIKNINTHKLINIKLSNMDKSYNYFKIYYVRYFADYGLNKVYECKKIFKKYPIKSSVTYLQITGNEEGEMIDANLLNISRFNPKSILTQAQCKNMLFFGNIVKNTDNYKELLDCALRIIPSLQLEHITNKTLDYNLGIGYYNSYNVYNKTGYFSQEFYRFGVVFIYKNGTLSNVYNTLGGILNPTPIEYRNGTLENPHPENPLLYSRNYIEIDDNGWIRNLLDYYENGELLNSKGVCKININEETSNQITGIKFTIPEEVSTFLKENMGIRGLFFVRLKRIPNVITLCYLMPFDEVLKAPVLQVSINDTAKYYTESFVSLGSYCEELDVDGSGSGISAPGARHLTLLYSYRTYKYTDPGTYISTNAYAAICPDFLLNLPYYNLIFNGSSFTLLRISSDARLAKSSLLRNFVISDGNLNYNQKKSNVKICSVTEDVPTVALLNKTYKLRIGEAEEAYRFEYCEVDNKEQRLDEITNYVRGIYSPYLAVYSSELLETGQLYNIYYESSESEESLFLTRMNSSEPFYAISDRYNFEQLDAKTNSYEKVCWRGDCYINNFTYRLNRNFNDPSLPNNDKFIDDETWGHYANHSTDPSEWSKISRSDINSIQLGSWITIRCRSYMNYALRSLDHSYVSEEALMGAPRSYYPRSSLLYRGNNKMPDSYVYNDAYRTSLGFKCYFTLSDINYIKDTFSNRIQYSAVSILDSFKNNYRESLTTYFRDYSQEYGGIMKLIGFEGHILVVFEHAIGLATINERILAGNGEGEPVFINTKNVLPEELSMITDTYGTQWPESVIKTEAGIVYGVDTIAKKIWRVVNNLLEILSDFKVNKFLIDNITLGERENYPIIGLKNVKTHYNNNKKDVMFTFYDDKHKDEESVWNLCYNELLGLFVTFYSWVPSYSENIDTQFFSFDRTTSKELTLLDRCNYYKDLNTGVLLENTILPSYPNIIGEEYAFYKTYDWNTDLNSYEAISYEYNSGDSGFIIDILEYPIIFEFYDGVSIIDSNNLIFYYCLALKDNSYYLEGYGIDGYDYNSLETHGPVSLNELSHIIENEKNLGANRREALIEDYKIFVWVGTGYASLLEGIVTSKWKLYVKRSSSISPVSYIGTKLHYIVPEIVKIENNQENSYKIKTENRELVDNDALNYKLEKDHWGNYKWFDIVTGNELKNNLLVVKNDVSISTIYETLKERNLKTILLYITPEINKEEINDPGLNLQFKTEVIALTFEDIVNNNKGSSKVDPNIPTLNTDFFLHGLAGIFDCSEPLLPTHWYGEYHPFEFEFIVNDKIGQLKIFTDLVIISNKAEPESFHFEIEGDNYEFSPDKRTMYFRQEATKNLYQNLGSDMLYDRNYINVWDSGRSQELYYNLGIYNNRDNAYPQLLEGLVKQIKSTIFPLYYERIDTYNNIYHKYREMLGEGYDFKNLSGSEVKWNKDLNQFNIVTHIKNSPIDRNGILRGNSLYREGRWNIQIPSITFMLKNEDKWVTPAEDLASDGPLKKYPDTLIPPIVVNSDNIPSDLGTGQVSASNLPNIYSKDKYNWPRNLDTKDWTYRKETKIRDKWMKVRVRYSGKNLAVIHSLITLYNVSYS